MSSLYNNAVKQSAILSKHLSEFRVAPEEAPSRLVGQVSTSITSFQKAVESYTTAVHNELDKDKKAQAQERVAKFREDLVSAREELRTLKTARENSIASKSRSELFRRPNANGAPSFAPSHGGTMSDNPFENSQSSQYANIDRASAMNKEGDALQRASQNIDEFLEMGRNALLDLSEQNEMLRKTSKSMRKVANTLGISNETIRKVERRAREDKLVFYGGAFTMLVFFYLIIRWLR